MNMKAKKEIKNMRELTSVEILNTYGGKVKRIAIVGGKIVIIYEEDSRM